MFCFSGVDPDQIRRLRPRRLEAGDCGDGGERPVTMIGKEGDVVKGAMLMFSFSLGMGMIFLVTGALAGWPRLGRVRSRKSSTG
jgi:hypothetical protein